MELPTGYDYTEYSMDDHICVRTNVKDFKEFKKWLGKYAAKSNTAWSMQYNSGSKTKVTKKYSCQHGSKRVLGKYKTNTK